MESQPEVDGETGDAQSFAFDTQTDEEPPAEIQVKQPVEVTHMGVEPEAVPSMVEEDVVEVASPSRGQTITSPPRSPGSFQTTPTTQSSLRSTMWFYERFIVRAGRPSTCTWLCCNDHPFFADLPNVPQKQNAFFDRIFAKEGDIFEGSSCIGRQ